MHTQGGRVNDCDARDGELLCHVAKTRRIGPTLLAQGAGDGMLAISVTDNIMSLMK